MSAHNPLSFAGDRDGPEIKRAAIATVVLIALFSVFAFAAPHDPAKVVSGVPCSVLSEEDISTALGAPMRLMPTSGTVCRYVSTGDGPSRTLFVIARRGAAVPAAMERDGSPLSGVGDAAIRSKDAVYVRYGTRSYIIDVLPSAPADAAPAAGDEIRLARMLHRPQIAQNH